MPEQLSHTPEDELQKGEQAKPEEIEMATIAKGPETPQRTETELAQGRMLKKETSLWEKVSKSAQKAFFGGLLLVSLMGPGAQEARADDRYANILRNTASEQVRISTNEFCDRLNINSQAKLSFKQERDRFLMDLVNFSITYERAKEDFEKQQARTKEERDENFDEQNARIKDEFNAGRIPMSSQAAKEYTNRFNRMSRDLEKDYGRFKQQQQREKDDFEKSWKRQLEDKCWNFIQNMYRLDTNRQNDLLRSNINAQNDRNRSLGNTVDNSFRVLIDSIVKYFRRNTVDDNAPNT